MPLRPSPLLGALCSVAAFAIYSLADITTKFLGSSYSPIQILFFSGMAGFPLILLKMMAEKNGGSLRPVLPVWTAARVVIVILNGLMVAYAFTALPLAQAYAIFFTMPLLICVLAVPILGEPIDMARGLAVLAGLTGVLVVLRPGHLALTWAHLSALGGSSLGALYYIIIRKTGAVERAVVIMIYPMMGQVLSVAVLLPLVYQPMTLLHLGLTGLMALFGFAGSLLIIVAYRLAPAIVVAPMQYVQIIVATLFGTYFFGEVMDLPTVVGIGVIIAAGLYIMLRSNNGQKPQTA